MQRIVQIEVECSAGFCPGNNVRKDKVILTPDTIDYEYKPYCETESNYAYSWRYQSEDQDFRLKYSQVANRIRKILKKDVEPWYDSGTVVIRVIYADGSALEKTYLRPRSYFEKLYCAIDDMVPEDVVLVKKRTSEDTAEISSRHEEGKYV